MPSYTVTDIMALDPCTEYSEARVTALWSGREALTAREIAELGIPVEDRIWALCQLTSSRIARLFACDCAERALQRVIDNGGSTDPRSWDAIITARLYAIGDRIDEDLRAAWSAARSAENAARPAAWAAARPAAWAAARVAAWAAARVAAWSSAWSSSWVAAWAAARSSSWVAAWSAAEAATGAAANAAAGFAAERTWQLARIVEMMEADDA